VHEHLVAGSWPRPDVGALAALRAAVGDVPVGAVLLVDGLVASCADTGLVPEAERLHLVVLVHLPLGSSDAAAAVGERRVLEAASAVVTTSDWTRQLLLVDGLVASCAAPVLVPEAGRVRLVVLVHLPLGLADPVAAQGEQDVLLAASAVVTTSDWTRGVLLDSYALAPDAVHVAHPGAELGAASTGTPEGGQLLCVAAVTAHKGHADLAAALGLVADLPWSCVVAGSLDREPDVVADLRQRLTRSGLADRVAERVRAGDLGAARDQVTALAVTLHESHVAWATYECDL
jgi:hypothetical protein